MTDHDVFTARDTITDKTVAEINASPENPVED